MRISMVILFALLVSATHAGPDATLDTPRIAIVIDDLGDRLSDGRRSINLPGAVTVGIIPYTPYARQLARLAQNSNKEILLHLPMEAMSKRYLGRGGLSLGMDREQFFATLHNSLRFLPGIRGVSNHMGSRLTQNEERMHWLMTGLKQSGGLYFLDSRTIDTSLALEVAEQSGIQNATRDVFLDHSRHRDKMSKQWRYFIKLAYEKGSAVCIAHPYAESLDFLNEKLANIENQGVRLVSVSRLIHWRKTRGEVPWQTSMSLSR